MAPPNHGGRTTNRKRITTAHLARRVSVLEMRVKALERDWTWMRETLLRISDTTSLIRERIEVLSQRSEQTEAIVRETGREVRQMCLKCRAGEPEVAQ